MRALESIAYTNRLRRVPAGAKAVFSACAFVAAFVARPMLAPAIIFVAVVAVTVLGAGVSPRAFFRAAAPAAAFLALSALTIAVSIDVRPGSFLPAVALDPVLSALALATAARAAACLAAMLFLVMTTPLVDLVTLARRLRVPGVLVDLMTVSYRAIGVFTDALADMRDTQRARLGYAGRGPALRSAGVSVAHLAVTTVRRSGELHEAALARGGGSEDLRFVAAPVAAVPAAWPLALLGGAALLAAAAVVPGVGL